MRAISFLSTLVLLNLVGCQLKRTETGQVQPASESRKDQHQLTLDYAQKFKIDYLEDIILVKILEPYKDATEGLSYYLIPKNSTVPDSLQNKAVIRTPVDRFVCTSTTHLPALDLLGITDHLVGFPSLHFVSSSTIRARANAGQVAELGRDLNLNTEKVMEVDPEVLMTFTMDGNYKHLSPVKKGGVDIVVNADYLENTPLGRAEWIKLFALLFHKEKKADSIFNRIASDYDSVLNQALRSGEQPTAFCGIDYKGVWHMPGGNSWMGKLLKDAHSNYLWSEDENTGSNGLSFETVYDSAYEADIWINAHTFANLQQLGETDERYKRFKAFQNGSVYNSNARTTDQGGNDYYESGIARPDVVLKDLVKIFHPDLLPDYELYFFQKLN